MTPMARGRTAQTPGPAWQVQAALVARRFYLEGRSKVEIAEELGLSRFKVARILEEAHEVGLVELRVHLPSPIDPELSTTLAERLGLRRAIVIRRSTDAPAPSVREELGLVAADLLEEVVGQDAVLGLSCSRTVAATTAALQSLPPCPIVQLTGTLAGPDMEAGSVESVRRATRVGGGQGFPIYAPMVLPDPATAKALSGEPGIRQAVARFPDVTVALVAVGAWEAELSTVWEQVPETERRAATRLGAVGEIGARLFDASGAAVSSPVDERVLGATLDQLREVPEVIGLAHGRGRTAAVHAAVTGGLVDTLVCDSDLARGLLEHVPEDVRRPGA
jgi:DNA-binding transcriptional regulator LsrR (DeoR family)